MAKRSLSSSGFSLIELIVSITILILMVGGGLAAFINFNDRQSTLGAAKELQTYLRSAQVKAQVGDRPEGCDALNGYLVTANQTAPVQVTISARCSNGDVVRDTQVLSGNVSLGGQLQVLFKGLQGGVDAEEEVTVMASNGDEYSFKITPGGEITGGAFEE